MRVRGFAVGATMFALALTAGCLATTGASGSASVARPTRVPARSRLRVGVPSGVYTIRHRTPFPPIIFHL